MSDFSGHGFVRINSWRPVGTVLDDPFGGSKYIPRTKLSMTETSVSVFSSEPAHKAIRKFGPGALNTISANHPCRDGCRALKASLNTRVRWDTQVGASKYWQWPAVVSTCTVSVTFSYGAHDCTGSKGWLLQRQAEGDGRRLN
jgi:hypothetical protein